MFKYISARNSYPLITGFHHIIIDDNSFPSVMDSYSLKFACDLHLGTVNSDEFMFTDNFDKIQRPFSAEDIWAGKQIFKSVIDIYFEFPWKRTWLGVDYSNSAVPASKWTTIEHRQHKRHMLIKHKAKNTIAYVKLFPYKIDSIKTRVAMSSLLSNDD